MPSIEKSGGGGTGNANYFTSGAITITAGGGDVTVNLDIDWTDGYLVVVGGDTAANWSNVANTTHFFSSYDALTNVAYSGENSVTYAVTGFSNSAKADNITGNPKASTNTSITFDDDTANTRIIKAFVFA